MNNKPRIDKDTGYTWKLLKHAKQKRKHERKARSYREMVKVGKSGWWRMLNIENKNEHRWTTQQEIRVDMHMAGTWMNIFWLVVLTILKNTSQWEGLSHIFWKKHVPNHQPVQYLYVFVGWSRWSPFLIPIFPARPSTLNAISRAHVDPAGQSAAMTDGAAGGGGVGSGVVVVVVVVRQPGRKVTLTVASLGWSLAKLYKTIMW